MKMRNGVLEFNNYRFKEGKINLKCEVISFLTYRVLRQEVYKLPCHCTYYTFNLFKLFNELLSVEPLYCITII